MIIKQTLAKSIITAGALIASLGVLPSVASAAGSGAIYVSPLNATVAANQPFDVSMVLSGGGSAFNAAGANITLTNLTVESITPVNCNFVILKSFSQADPSFAGGYLNGSSTGCTVYTMKVVAKNQGLAKISFKNGTMKSAATSADMLSTLAGATYIVKGSVPAQPSASSAALSSYTIQVKVVDANNQPVSKAQVFLVKNPPVITSTDKNGMASLSGLTQGVYSLSVIYQGEKQENNVIVGGDNANIPAQFKLNTSSNGPLPLPQSVKQPWVAFVLALAALIIAALIVLAVLRPRKRSAP